MLLKSGFDLVCQSFEIVFYRAFITFDINCKITVIALLNAKGNVNINGRRSFALKIQEIQLKNKIPVLLCSQPDSDVVSLQVWVRVGSAKESKPEQGLSHFVEHLVFKGSEGLKDGEIAERIEGAGGVLNAYTSFDQTVYYVTVPKASLDLAIETLSQLVLRPLFHEPEVNSEREVVIEEIRMTSDDPSRQIARDFFRLAFQGHPYSLPVIGRSEVVKDSSVRKIRDFYRHHYTADNIFVVATGGFESKSVVAQLSRHFLPSKPETKSKKKSGSAKKKSIITIGAKPTIEVIEKKTNRRVGILAWPFLKSKKLDLQALEVAVSALGSGESSRLHQSLVVEKNLVSGVSASVFEGEDVGAMLVQMQFKDEPSSWKSALSALRLEIESVLQTGIFDKELLKVKNQMFSDARRGIETVDGLARRIGDSYFSKRDPKFFEKELARLKGISKADALKALTQVLGDLKGCRVIVHTPDGMETFEEGLADFFKVLRPKGKGTRSILRKQNEIQFLKLKNGLNVLISPKPSTGLFSLRWGFLGGELSESANEIGHFDLYTSVWGLKSDLKDERRLSETCDELSASFSAFSGKNTFGYSLDGLTESFVPSLDLFGEALWSTECWTEKAFERERVRLNQHLKNRLDRPDSIASLLFYNSLFPNHPYGWDSPARSEVGAGLNTKSLKSWVDTKRDFLNSLIVVDGDFDGSALLNFLEKRGQDSLPSNPTFSPPVAEPLKPNQHGYYKFDGEQSHLMIGFRGLCHADKRRPDLLLLNSILSGMGGRLFRELRDKASLAYSVSSFHFEGLRDGGFGGYIACQPAKVKVAFEMMMHEFRKLADSGPTVEEVNRARSYVLGKFMMAHQKCGNRASQLLFDWLYTGKTRTYQTVKKELESVSAEGIRTLAESLFAGPHTVVLVGPDPVSF